MTMRFEILDRRVAYDGFFRILEYQVQHALFEGGMSRPATRELFVRDPTVGVLPYDADRDEVVMVEQFRVGALEHNRDPWLIEVIAGIIEPGESPETVVHREAGEEAGCPLAELEPIARYLVSPGGSSEETTLYCARATTSTLGGVHGREDEGEDIRVRVMSFDEAFAMLRDGTIHAAMPIMALQWLALNRERLRSLWGSD